MREIKGREIEERESGIWDERKGREEKNEKECRHRKRDERKNIEKKMRIGRETDEREGW